MPNPTPADRTKPALALSGGGFRATLFHCGALLRFNELGLLRNFERISSVSGGSIVNGMLGAAWTRLQPQGGGFANLEAEVIAPLRAFCKRNIDKSALAWGALPGKSTGEALAELYDEHLYQGMQLSDLPDRPQLVFNATNLQTGRLVRMQKARLADYRLGEIRNPAVSLAQAVAASSAFPPVLSPVDLKISSPASWVNLEGADLFGNAAFNRRLALTDGGAYDNLGLETIDDFAQIFVSDAGAPFGAEATSSAFWPKQAMRALDIATDQTRALRKRLLFAECAAHGRTAVYAGIDADPGKYPAAQVLIPKPEVIALLAGMRTRLDSFSEKEQGQLINWGWLITDVAARSFVLPDAPAPIAYPIPKFAL